MQEFTVKKYYSIEPSGKPGGASWEANASLTVFPLPSPASLCRHALNCRKVGF